MPDSVLNLENTEVGKHSRDLPSLGSFIGFLQVGGGGQTLYKKKKKKSNKTPHEHRRDRSHKIKAQNTMYGFSLNLGVKESLPAGLLPSSLVAPGMVKHLPSSPSWDKRGDGAPTTSHQ